MNRQLADLGFPWRDQECCRAAGHHCPRPVDCECPCHSRHARKRAGTWRARLLAVACAVIGGAVAASAVTVVLVHVLALGPVPAGLG